MKRYKSIINEDSKDITQTKEFKKWFGNSKVTKNGKPLIVYHGTDNVFKRFNLKNNSGYFTYSKNYAKLYGKNIINAFLKIEKPFIINWDIDIGPNYDEPYMTKNRFIEEIKKINKNIGEELINYFDEDTEQETWEYINTKIFKKLLKKNKYDGLIAIEKGNKILFPLENYQIKIVDNND